jgi:single-stranded-DNA-specific exonuclease
MGLNIKDIKRYASSVKKVEESGPSTPEEFITKVVGVSFEGRQNIIKNLTVNTKIKLERDSDNRFDKNAVKVITESGEHLGFLARGVSKLVAPEMDRGIIFNASIDKFNSLYQDSDRFEAVGLNIRVSSC